MRQGHIVVIVGLIAIAAGCRSSTPHEVDGGPTETAGSAATSGGSQEQAEEQAGPLPAPVLPTAGRGLTPSMAEMKAGEEVDVERLLEVDECRECHAEIAEQWEGSMHRWSSFNNPIYQRAFDAFVGDNGSSKARFCGGCHDLGLMFDDAIVATVEPRDPRAHAGITCNACHGVVEATTEGNGSYTLTTSEVPLPKDGDDASLQAHLARVGQPALRSDALCASCHVGFINAETGHAAVVSGLNEHSPWRRSGYNGSRGARLDKVEGKRCVDCHMPMVEIEDGDKVIRSHRFPGGHSTMAAMNGDAAQLEAITRLLQSAARLDVIGLGEGLSRPAVGDGEAAVAPGQELAFDVVVVNQGVGHKLPGGVLDLRDTWVEVVVTDAEGAVVASAGVEHEESGEDPSAHRLRALVVTEEGKGVLDHRVAHFRTPAYDNSVPPRSAAVVRYSLKVPEGLDAARQPLAAKVRLRHRRLNRSIHASVCEDASGGRAKAFLDANAKFSGQRVDPCVEQPVIDIAEATSWFGEGAEARMAEMGGERLPWWVRLYYRGLGLEAHIQERLQEAQVTFEAALEAAPVGDGERGRLTAARIKLELGRVAGKQGRTRDAEALFDEVKAVVGEHPAVALARGRALARVWRWKEAAAAFEVAARLAPQDDGAWRQLAIAQGSAGNHRRALEAARAGLKLEPRDPHLLRSQMLALQRLAPDDPGTAKARESFLAFKRDERAPTIQSACSDASKECWLERLPVHTHPLTLEGAP